MKRILYTILGLLILSHTACNQPSGPSTAGGGGGGPAAGNGTGSGTLLGGQDVPKLSGDPNQKAVQDFPFSFLPDITGSGYTFSANKLPEGFTLNPATGRIDACPEKVGVFSDIEVIANKDGKEFSKMTFSVTVAGDTYRDDQWHLHNTAQKAFARDPGVAGEDLRVKVARCRFGANGSNVKWLVSDDGLDIKHEDLAENVLTELTRKYPNVTSPGDPGAGGGHGTAVSGIIAAVEGNSRGVRGIAPKTKIAGNNYLSAQDLVSRLDQAFPSGVDGANYSYGSTWCDSKVRCRPIIATDPLVGDGFKLELAAIKEGAAKGRSGRGIVYIKSAGNDHHGFVEYDKNDPASNFFFPIPVGGDPMSASPHILIVSAMAANGMLASYSSFGAEIWVSATGGEFAFQTVSKPSIPNDSYFFRPAMVTTDVTAAGGFSPASGRNDFNRGLGGLNTQTNYTNVMNGTSSAAPSASGVAALVLQANPNLRWEDVHYILARTARFVDQKRGPGEPLPWPAHEPISVSGTPTDVVFPTPYPWDTQKLYNPAWITNGAGLKYSTWYGFGAVDAEKALEKAIGYTSPFGTLADSSAESAALALDIPNDGKADGVTSKLTVSAPAGKKIFTVTVQVSLTAQDKVYEMALFLKSPSGTQIPVLIAPNSYNMPGLAGLTDYVVRANGFLDEDPNGDWELKAVDTLLEPGSPSSEGQLTKWKITVWHH